MPTNEKLPTAERLPPDGYELGPGWIPRIRMPWTCTMTGACREDARYWKGRRGDGACVAHAESMGAIVRKAEATTFEQALSGATAALGVIGTGALREALVTEGPRTYAVTVEAPAAPSTCSECGIASIVDPSDETGNDRIDVRVAAAVQAERERCLGWWDWWWDRPDVTGSDFEDRIKNGDPAP